MWASNRVKEFFGEMRKQYPAILTSRLVNNAMNLFHADPYKSGKVKQ